MTKKILLPAALAVTVLLLVLFFFIPRPESQTAQALRCFKEGQSTKAEQIICSLPLLPNGRNHLLRGYLEQFRGKFSQSDHWLQCCLKESADPKARLEACLALAINAYCKQRDGDLLNWAERASEIDPKAASFFEALAHYLQSDYEKAWLLWQQHNPEELPAWLKCAKEKQFPPSWINIHVAHCLIEQNQVMKGRELLEKELNTNPPFHDKSALYLGLSYLKEAQSRPCEQRPSFYEMARFYFAMAGEPTAREKAQLACTIAQETKSLLNTRLPSDVEKWAYEFIGLLGEWQAFELLDLLAHQLSNKLAQLKGDEALAACISLKAAFFATPFQKMLQDKIKQQLVLAIATQDNTKYGDLSQLLDTISCNPEADAHEILGIIAKAMADYIHKDSLELDATRAYIALWQRINKNVHHCDLLARDLLFHARLSWQHEGHEIKGLHLMGLALQVAGHKEPVEQQIVDFLKSLHQAAINCHMVRRQMVIYEAMEHFGYSQPDILSKERLANYLADAAYLFNVRNFPEAIFQAALVLKFDPENERAHLIAGLSAFQLGAYKEALGHLKQLRQPDDTASRALQLSQAFASQESCLCQSDGLLNPE